MTTIVSTWLRPGEVAIQAAVDHLQTGATPLDAIVEGLAAAEEDPNLIAIGRGSLPNTDGEIELDAAVMRGDTLDAGAVCGVRGIVPIVKVARLVMERTPHVLLCGDQARRFALECGFHPQSLWTDELNRRWAHYVDSPERARAYVHSVEDGSTGHDTVTMLARSQNPETVPTFAAASSTSGMPYKLPGRVGDSPIIGAGLYADDEAGAAGATGWGEELWKTVASFRAVERMRQGHTAQEACESVIQDMLRRRPQCVGKPCVVIALDRLGGHGAAVVGGSFDLWVSDQNGIDCHHYPDLRDQ